MINTNINSNLLAKSIDKNDNILSFGISFSLFALFLQNFLQYLTFISVGSPLLLIPKIALFTVYLFSLPSFFKKLNNISMIAFFCCIFFFSFNLLFNENQIYLQKTITEFSLNCLPPFLFVLSLSTFQYLYRHFLNMSRAVSVLLILALASKTFNLQDNVYAMGLSYSLIFFYVFLLHDFVQEKRLSSLILQLPIIFVILSYGARGSFACIIAYVAIYLYRNLIFKTRIKQTIGMIAALVFLVLSFNKIVKFLYNFMLSRGIYSRNIDSLVNGRFTSSDARIDIYNNLMEIFHQNPFALRGINAEYREVGIYAHNIFIELLYQFGFILGGLFILCILALIFRSVYSRSEYFQSSITIIFLSVWFPYLMLSSSLWISPYFWIFLGLNLNLITEKYRKTLVYF